MKRLLTVAAATTALVGMATAPASAKGGPDPENLEKAGWFCFSHPGVPALHCVPDIEAVLSGEVVASNILSWGITENGEYVFWGTEQLIREDKYHGQPCPQDELHVFGDGDAGQYLDVSETIGDPIPYMVCHHFEAPIT